MECPYCKAENRDGVRYCGSCGKLLEPVVPLSPTPGGTGGIPRSLVAGARLQGGRYVIRKILGEGGMGAALLATDIRLDSKLVVIKELISDNMEPAKAQEDVRNFKREVATLAHIDHPLVPNVTDHFQEGSRYFMVQEYVEGETLEDRLNRTNQPMKERDALVCASEILDVLDYLAQQTPPIVHRDIKPANIIIGAKDKRAHLVDFGIARADVARNAQRKQTSALGTPGYAPPEQYQGNADPRSDLYALGATLHHLLTNRDPRQHPPFTYPPVRALNPQLSPQIERVLARALNNDINQRYPSAAAMKQEIDDILLHRFGISGNINSYTLGASGPMGAVTPPTIATASTLASVTQMPTIAQPPTPIPATAPSTPPQLPYLTPQYASSPGASPSFPGGYSNQPQQKRRGGIVSYVVPIVLLVLLIGAGILAIPYVFHKSVTASVTPVLPVPPSGIGVSLVGKESIGISDGTFAFDTTGRADSALKLQATQHLKQNSSDTSTALSLLGEAVAQDSNDAEALIYLEDLRVLGSGSPYVTLVVGTMITGDSSTVSVGRDSLQGAYVAQKEFNDGAKIHGGVLVRLLIANSGSKTEYTTGVAQQIVQLAQADKTFVGVMGWPFSSRAVQAIQVLGKARIPMVSSTASSDLLTRSSPYFFRVAPSNKSQAIAGAQYTEQVLHAKTVALFYDPTDPYSQSLAQDFSAQFKTDGNTIVNEEKYTVNKPSTLPDSLQKALNAHPDAIYFSGYASDVSTLLVNLPPGTIPVMGGDALYELGGYTGSARANFSRLHFTTFAYPDQWGVLGLDAQKPAFFSEYATAFDPNSQHQGSPYGFTRPDNDTILSYDAMVALLKGCDIAFSGGKQTIKPEDLRQALTTINGANAFQGVSGQIAFGADGDPIDKAIVILFVDPDGHIKMEPTRLGRFLK